MKICPFCGAVYAQSNSLKMTSQRISALNSDHEMKCFCSLDLVKAKNLYQKMETKLSAILEKEFPRLGKIQIEAKLSQMPRDLDLRVDIMARWQYLDRLKAHIKKLSQNSLESKEEENTVSKKEHPVFKGLSGWLDGLKK
jgi:hypothetical protein